MYNDDVVACQREIRRLRAVIREYEDGESEIFAQKVWFKQDIKDRLDVLGCDTTNENVERVIKLGNERDWSYLEECTDEEWDYIDHMIEEAMEA